MKISFYSTRPFEKSAFIQENEFFHHHITFLDARLNHLSTGLAVGSKCICVFVNDPLTAPILLSLKDIGVELIALRSAGFNHVDLRAARDLGLKVVRVPEYSPYAIAEHAVALILSLNRKIHRAYNRVREGNFSLDGLVGFDLHGKTVGVIGTGHIGMVFARILQGFGCKLLLNDLAPDYKFSQDVGGRYTTLDEMFTKADIISLHVPLTATTKHIICDECISMMKRGVMIINTGRGGLIDTRALIKGLKSGQIGHAGLDVYEEEENLFFGDHSGEILDDDVLARLMTFPNVIITGHQGFLTNEALANIARTTLKNVSDYGARKDLPNQVR